MANNHKKIKFFCKRKLVRVRKILEHVKVWNSKTLSFSKLSPLSSLPPLLHLSVPFTVVNFHPLLLVSSTVSFPCHCLAVLQMNVIIGKVIRVPCSGWNWESQSKCSPGKILESSPEQVVNKTDVPSLTTRGSKVHGIQKSPGLLSSLASDD